MMPASTKGEPVGAIAAATRSTVGGLTALQSTKTGLLLLAVSAGREPLRQRDGVARRQDRQDEIGRRDLLVAGGQSGRLSWRARSSRRCGR